MATASNGSSRYQQGHEAAHLPFDRGARPYHSFDSPSPSPYDPWGLFEERLRTGPFNISQRVYPFRSLNPLRLRLDEDELGRHGEMMSPGLRQFVRASPLRFDFSNRFEDDRGGTNLTAAEVDTVMGKLAKEVYKPHSRKESKEKKNKNNGENDQICSICLEEFFAKEQLLCLPCKHRFHEDCLMPWIKSHGQCPVCRLDLTGRRRNEDNATATSPVVRGPLDASAAEEMALLIRAMEEAFSWLNPYQR